MRTTVDLPDDLHRVARQLAADEGLTMSAVVARLMRSGLGERSSAHIGTDAATGLPVVRLGRPLTAEDVAALLEDD